MTPLEYAARAVLLLLTDYQKAALVLLADACAAGLPMATAGHLIRSNREGEAREMLERWADGENG